MVTHVEHSVASKTKFRNQKEATISYLNEDVIKLRNFKIENSLTKNWISFKIFMLGFQWTPDKGNPSVAHT